MARLKLTAENAGQERILAYLEENASDSLVDRINDGKKTMGSCWQYITGMARKRAKGNCACIEDSEVYNWAIHYFEEDNVRIDTAQPEKKEEKQTISFAEIKAIQKEKERKAQQEALDRINEAKRKEEQLRKEKQKEEERKRKAAGGIDGQLSWFDLIGGE